MKKWILIIMGILCLMTVGKFPSKTLKDFELNKKIAERAYKAGKSGKNRRR